jgi:hypothetical protein
MVMNSPRCNAAQNTCTFSLIMCLKNLATNTLIPTGVATTARTRGSTTGHSDLLLFHLVGNTVPGSAGRAQEKERT